jgi:hypothetical protein
VGTPANDALVTALICRQLKSGMPAADVTDPVLWARGWSAASLAFAVASPAVAISR